jgi:hypothetical protein
MDSPEPIQAVESPAETPVFPASIHGPTVGTGQYDTAKQPLEPHLPVDYQERFSRIIKKTDFAPTVFAHIANGGTLITLADIWGVRFSDLSAYIAHAPELSSQYQQALIARNEWEQERLLQELRSIATVDIRQAYDDQGRLRPIQDIPANVASAISMIESDELRAGDEVIGKARKVKFWDKAKAIEMFMRKHGLLVDRVKHEGTIRLEDLATASAEILQGELVTDVPATVESVSDDTKKSEQTPSEGG